MRSKQKISRDKKNAKPLNQTNENLPHKRPAEKGINYQTKKGNFDYFLSNSFLISSSIIFAIDRFSFSASFFSCSSAFSESLNDVTFLLIMFAFNP